MSMRAYGPMSDATWMRAKGWAIAFGVTLLETGLADSPRHAVMGERTLRWVPLVHEDGPEGPGSTGLRPVQCRRGGDGRICGRASSRGTVWIRG
jgi:hypothetical protein